MIPYLLDAVGRHLIGDSMKDSETFAKGGKTKESYQEQLNDLVKDFSMKEYKLFANEFDIDINDADEMTEFIYHTDNKEAKELIKQIQDGYYKPKKW